MCADAERVLPRKVPLAQLPAKQKKRSVCKTSSPIALPFSVPHGPMAHDHCKRPQLFFVVSIFFGIILARSLNPNRVIRLSSLGRTHKDDIDEWPATCG